MSAYKPKGTPPEFVPKFGKAVEDTPPAMTDYRVAYWYLVVDHVKKNPDTWIPLENSPHSPRRLKDISSAVGLPENKGYSENVPIAFRQNPQVTARFRLNKLYVKWVSES